MHARFMVLAVALVAVPVTSRAQRPDTIKKVDTAKVDAARIDTARKESTAEKVGRQTGTSLDKAARTTEHNAKVLGKRTADNTKQGVKDTRTDVAKVAGKAAHATKTNATHLKKSIRKATADTIRPPAKPDSTRARRDSVVP